MGNCPAGNGATDQTRPAANERTLSNQRQRSRESVVFGLKKSKSAFSDTLSRITRSKADCGSLVTQRINGIELCRTARRHIAKDYANCAREDK
jgi:hypothetical protein